VIVVHAKSANGQFFSYIMARISYISMGW